MTPSPAVVEFAVNFGIDLINGEHDRYTAEAARRVGLELLRFPQWRRAELELLVAAKKQILAEEQRALGQMGELVDEMRRQNARAVADLPAEILCRILQCKPDQIEEAFQRLMTFPWWFEGAGDEEVTT